VTIRVVIADDHRVVRDGLCYLLGQEPDVEVAGEAGDGRQAIDLVAATRPDVLLLDLYMPGVDGHAVLAALHDAPHRPAVVVLTSATPGVCHVSGDTVTYTQAGTCVIDANQAGNDTYADAPQVQRSIKVIRVLQYRGISSSASGSAG